MARKQETHDMLLIVLEAFFAMALLIFIVWWTMFSGRKKGEPDRSEDRGA